MLIFNMQADVKDSKFNENVQVCKVNMQARLKILEIKIFFKKKKKKKKK